MSWKQQQREAAAAASAQGVAYPQLPYNPAFAPQHFGSTPQQTQVHNLQQQLWQLQKQMGLIGPPAQNQSVHSTFGAAK